MESVTSEAAGSRTPGTEGGHRPPPWARQATQSCREEAPGIIMEWKPLTMLPCDDRTARERCQGPRRLQEKATPQSLSPADGADGCKGGVCRGVRRC